MGLQLKTSVLLTPADNGYLAYHTDTERFHHLNPTAALIVELCDGSLDVKKLREAILPLGGNDTWAECERWIAQAVDDGLLIDSAAAAPPPSVDALKAMSRALRKRGRVLAAFVCQQRVTELAPQDSAAWFALGELAHIVGRRTDARAAYERYFAHHPDDAEIALILTALRDEPAPARASAEFVEQLYSRFASFYDESMTNDLEYCAPALLFDAMTRTLGSQTTRRERVLDLGCGTGLSGQLWRPRAARLVGVDLSPQMIERARARRLYDEVHVADITEWLSREPAGQAFDCLVACDALIYFGDLRQVLCPARQWIAPGGLLGFTTERSDDDRPFRLTDAGRFVHHRDHIREAARDAGLSDVSVDEGILRYEYGEPVHGLIAVCRC